MTHTHVLIIRTTFANMQMPFPDLHSAMVKARESAASGQCRTPETVLMFGSGTLLNVLSTTEIPEIEKDLRATAASGNIALPERFSVDEEDHVLFIQDAAAPGSLPPLTFPTRQAVDNAITFGLKNGYIEYILKEGHDHLFIVLGAGMLLMPQTSQQYHEQRRARMANQMRQQAQQPPPGGGPRIILSR